MKQQVGSNNRLGAYLLAAGAVAAGANTQAAEVIWDLSALDPSTRTTTVNGSSIYFDLNATSAADVVSFSSFVGFDGTFSTVSSTVGSGSTATINYTATAGGTPMNDYVAFQFKSSPQKVAYLASGVTVNGSASFINGGPLAQTSGGGKFGVGSSGYVGLRFDISGETHYGWVNLTVNPDYTVTVNQAGYDDTPGAASVTSGVPEPSALGLVALGATGLMAWRRRK